MQAVPAATVIFKPLREKGLVAFSSAVKGNAPGIVDGSGGTTQKRKHAAVVMHVLKMRMAHAGRRLCEK
jgi:hypothetical protein